MARMRKFESRDSVKARKVTEDGGEDVITALGSVHAEKGDYVVDRDGAITVEEAETFEAHYKTPTKKRAATRRPDASEPEPPTPPVAQPGDVPASERVKMAQKATQSGSNAS